MKSTKHLLKLTAILATGLIIFTGCIKNDFDEPPQTDIPVGAKLTVAQLRALFNGEPHKFTGDTSVYGYIVMDESTGNIYKSAYLQDSTGAINLHLQASGGLYEGDYVRLYMKGCVLSDYSGVLQVDSVNVDKNIIKQSTNNVIEPRLVTISQLNTGIYESQLIKLEGVQFADGELGNTWADPVNLYSENRALEDCDGNTIVVRTSGYSEFAGEIIPEGNGTLIAVASEYNGEMQLYIRDPQELSMTGERCGGPVLVDPVNEVNEAFNSVVDYEDVDISGWTNIYLVGNRKWQGKSFSGNKYVQATGYNSGLTALECWLITPPVINTASDKKMSFKCAMAYWEHNAGNQPITVLASTNFDGTNVETATWTELSCDLPTSGSTNYEFIESGVISLAQFTGNVSIAFKYTGSATESTSIQIDDVIINLTGGGGGGGGDHILEANFDGGWDNFETISVTGTEVWERNNTYGINYTPCARMSGYSGGSHANEDWLISPAMDLSSYSTVTLVYNTAMNYSGDDIIVLISDDYDGGGDPSSATWTELGGTLSSGSWEWTESGDVSLSDYAGASNIYIAFKYISNTSQSATWEVDNVTVDGE